MSESEHSPAAPENGEQSLEKTVDVSPTAVVERAREFGGRKDGTEPTRFGDWEKNGRCIDF